MRRFLLVFLLLIAGPAFAQSVVLDSNSIQPNASSTIASTNVFQQVWPANGGRKSCTIQNNSTHTMFLYLGPIVNATTTNSAQLLASGGSANCNVGPIVSSDQISITGTSGDAFYANQQ